MTNNDNKSQKKETGLPGKNAAGLFSHNVLNWRSGARPWAGAKTTQFYWIEICLALSFTSAFLGR